MDIAFQLLLTPVLGEKIERHLALCSPQSKGHLPVVKFWGGADGRVAKALDSQARDRGFESRHALGLLCLKSLGKICTLNVPWGDR